MRLDVSATYMIYLVKRVRRRRLSQPVLKRRRQSLSSTHRTYNIISALNDNRRYMLAVKYVLNYRQQA